MSCRDLGMTRLLVGALLALAVHFGRWEPASAAEAQMPVAAPKRIVSLNLCADQLLVDLADLKRIAAVSFLAADASVSAIAEKARDLPTTRGEAESVLAFDPDLVLAGAFSTPATVSILERIGRRVVRVPQANDLEGIKTSTRLVATAIGEVERGEALIQKLEAKLKAAAADAPRVGRRLSALVYQVNGISAGDGSLGEAVLGWAGFDNHGEKLRLGRGGQVPLEAVVANPPDLIVLTGPANEYRTVVAENLRHPALDHVMRERAAVIVPWRWWLCGTPHVGTAVELLAAERRKLLAAAQRSPDASGRVQR